MLDFIDNFLAVGIFENVLFITNKCTILYLSGDDRHVVILNLHDKGTDIETRVDDSESKAFVGFHVENCQRRVG